MKQELLPFNLEEALKNPERVVYRNGEKPLEWHLFEKLASKHKLYSITKSGIMGHMVNGLSYDNESKHPYDLLLLPLPEKRYWVNVHKEGDLLLIGSIYYTEDLALRQALGHSNYIKTISFTI